ncbi:MAG TPA: hypothetical protein VE734_06700 [Terriglobales bacterium]|nr:hypothetical protein [Terriglobales bacterium]
MVQDAAAAEYISELLLDISGRLDESVAIVKQRWLQEDAAYRRAVGKVLYEVYAELLNPLYLRHPTLKPSGWESD